MADFSFSFDSDNPFAEPEPASPPPAAKSASAHNTTDSKGNGESTESTEDSLEAAFDFGGFDLSNADDEEPAPKERKSPAEDNPFAFDGEPLTQTGNAVEPLSIAPEEFTSIASPATSSTVETPEPATNEADNEPGQNDFLVGEPLLTEPVAAEMVFTDLMFADPVEGESKPGAESGDAKTAGAATSEVKTEDAPQSSASAARAAGFDFSFGDDTDDIFAEKEPVPATAGSALADEKSQGTERKRPAPPPAFKVAILGASGIGKNHARWFHRHGARIVAFLGTSESSVAATQEKLGSEFAFEGQAYTDLEALLQTEKPDIVCVATPPALHFGHVLQSLEAGAHVLCEKPLVYAPTRKFRENRDGAKELVKVAAKKNLVLGTQLQYGAATPILCKLAGLSTTEVGDFAMEIETNNPAASRDPRELWIDLGPHPVSIAQMLAGEGATLAEETIRFEPYQGDDKTEVMARFGLNCADGRLLMVRAIVRSLASQSPTRKPRRRFSFNGHPIIYAALPGPRGNFQAQFIGPDGYSNLYSDPVDYLIGNFLRACRGTEALLISGDFGRENLEWMLKVGSPQESR